MPFTVHSPFKALKKRWHSNAGYHEVLKVAIPLILSTTAWSIQHVVDRIFLTWYSSDAIAASVPAGILNFTVMSLFIGTAGYVSTFVAQYYGAERDHRIGPVIWQGVYIACIGAAVHLIIIPAAGPLFRFIGHSSSVQRLEADYFKVLCAGAGLATVLSGCFSFTCYLIMILQTCHNNRFHTRSGWRIDIALFKRLIRFGLPGGIQFFLDVAGFSVFILLIGRISTASLAATNIALNINSLAFMPMIGCGIAVSILVGQYLGKNKPDCAEKCVYSGFYITIAYISVWTIVYIALPHMLLLPYQLMARQADFRQIRDLAVILLRFVAVYSLFDTMNIIFASALKGAGDTRYIMYMLGLFSICGLVIPSYIALEILHRGILTLWTIVTAYIILLGFSFLLRFIKGPWKSMRVIEESVPVFPTRMPDIPGSEFEV